MAMMRKKRARRTAAGKPPGTRGKAAARRRQSTDVPERKRRESAGIRLKRERIVKTALEIVDRDGLKALSMRRLGAELGVDPMAVYYHLPNKQALLDAIVEAVMASIDLSVDNPAKSAEERILGAARAYCNALLAHVNALPILLVHGPATAAAMRPVELLIGILRDAGLAPPEALAGMNLIAAAVRGAVGMGGTDEPSNEEFDAVWQALPATEFPRLAEAMGASSGSFEEFFEFGIRAIAVGLLIGGARIGD